MIKAGGGRGMRVIQDGDSIQEAIIRAKSEAEQAFGNGAIFLERRAKLRFTYYTGTG